jgi:hypothetical protein
LFKNMPGRDEVSSTRLRETAKSNGVTRDVVPDVPDVHLPKNIDCGAGDPARQLDLCPNYLALNSEKAVSRVIFTLGTLKERRGSGVTTETKICYRKIQQGVWEHKAEAKPLTLI